jgi:hypothetical protein
MLSLLESLRHLYKRAAGESYGCLRHDAALWYGQQWLLERQVLSISAIQMPLRASMSSAVTVSYKVT